MTSIEGFEHYIIFEDGIIMNQFGKEMKPWENHDAYYQYSLSKNGKRKNFTLHRLLALTFIPNPDNLPEVDHIDRDRSNNNLENLHWVTALENCQNKGIPKTNTSGDKNITWVEVKKHWRFEKKINGKRHTKSSKDKQVVIDFKAKFYLEHNLKD
tara:strand:+ start:48 stop:512 length:465 start_codon:yes stop_codon:yes gene_type:complete